MTPRRILWGSTALLYLLFFFWYTNTGGALNDEEIAMYIERFTEVDRDPETVERIRRFMEEDTGDDFVMINLMHLNPNPPNLPLTGDGAEAAELLDAYMEYMYPALFSRASHPIFAGPAVNTAMDLHNMEGFELWSQGVLMRYRSRRDLMEIASNPAFDERHEYKLGGLMKTVAFPIESQMNLGEPRLLLFLLLFSVAAAIDLSILGRASR